MSKFIMFWGAVAVVLLGLTGFAGWIFSLPSAIAAAEPPPVPQEETDAMLAALRHEGQGRPLVAVVGINEASETTDYLLPTGILRRADIAEVVMLASGEGPVQLYPALQVKPDATIADFDAEHPQGADYVIVPAMSRDDDPVVVAWLRDQSGKGARIIGVCAGAKVVGAAGLLDNRRATTHWYYLREMLKHSPSIDYVADRRFVADEGVVTTTGISASMQVQPGMDEVSLALVADAWSRTYRSSVVTFAESASVVTTVNGVRVLPDRADDGWSDARRVSIPADQRPADALDQTLDSIADLYGESTTNVVAMQLEYPRTPLSIRK